MSFLAGCNPPVEVRVYDAPKSDTEFVSGPMAEAAKPVGRKSTTPASGPRRILGAVIPTESGCFFLKATDSPERMQGVMSDLYGIVSEFSISESTGKPDMKLPDGWTMNPRKDIAMAEFVSPEATGSIKFTVTVLGMPPASEWQSYLLSNINRWRGQLNLPELDTASLAEELISVNRPGSILPGYIFDAIGSGSGSMGGGSMGGGASKPPFATAPATELTSPPPPKTPIPADSSTTADSKKPELIYQVPEGWQTAPGTPFRLATFGIRSAEGEGEVTVSMAVDNPLANSMMWHQQVTREADEEKLKALAETSIANAETVPASKGEARLYTIRDSEQIDAPVLLVASIPSDRPDLHLFVKLRGDNRLAQAERNNLIQFIQSLSLK